MSKGSSLRRKMTNAAAGLALGFTAAMTLFPATANAWWNDEWQLRKKINIDVSATGANITDPIGTVPTLVRLHAGNFRFSLAKEDGSDLRFVATDDKTPLKHHIEKWDSLLGEALVWVSLPNVASGAKSDFWLYYGNKKAAAANDAKGTYDADTALVYHFNERGTPAIDSSVWANNAQSVGQAADGSLIGNGLRLDGRNIVTLPASPSLGMADGAPFTWSAWVKPAAMVPNSALFSRRDGGNGMVIGFDNGSPFIEVSNAAGTQRSGVGAPVAANSWHHLAVVAASGTVTIYLDGAPYATLNASLPALTGVARLGGDAPPPAAAAPVAPAADAAAPVADGTAPAVDAAAAPVAVAAMAGFVGDIDELQISKIARSPGFIKFASTEQGSDPTKLIAFSNDEETASWMSGHFAIILKSVTIDGWIVIVMLIVMAAASWIVTYDRVSYMKKQAGANDRFMKSFRKLADNLTALDRGEADENAAVLGSKLGEEEAQMVRASSLYRIYHVGAEQISHRFANNEMIRLNGASISAIRAALDSVFVKESQRLNKMMVVLTISISGGPFLGLLGTVVGVMITFAAIAESGDVNVNAIAPGIAAALVATVAGLLVAIPALFAYNYLVTRIGELTTDMQVFIDEFVTKMAEFYSTEAIVDHRQAAE
ncbi:MotA/TolQ/ExbB proton channel family protein [Tardiphaga alba]|uniref:MotA/TolQ/ExbB proton channel family protein n=1 Tax=Tardiphaga alba TaxID=340268 RepID=A0ABX8A9F3_9BRAD|nr:MotA/TolQ/ExbB proton channel family protein [Tardiphaga alba]